MAGRVRLNKIIDLLEQGKTVFCGGLVNNGNFDDILYLADSDYDCCIIEMEHEAFSFTNLRNSVQQFLNRRRILERGNLQPDVVPLVRIPANARELGANQWIIKQTLDTGAFGLVLPHLNTVDEAKAAVVATRYPRVPGHPDFELVGQRGAWLRLATRFWGLTPQEYFKVADLWPLNPDGEILLMGIVESVDGVRNLRDILREVKGIGAIWAGAGDLSVSMGKAGNAAAPEVQAAVMNILETCKEFNVPCATGATAANVQQRIEEGFRIIVAGPRKVNDVLEAGKRAAGR